MRRAAHRGMLGAYRLIFARGLLRLGWGRRLYFMLYDLYKSWFEAGRIGGLRAFVPRGSLAIDVGAGVGFFAVRFAHWVGPLGRVVALEPHETHHTELVRRLAANGLAARVDVRRVAADCKSGSARLLISPDHPGDHRLGETGEPVSAAALDDIVLTGSKVSLVKIDVQGAELRVLAGASALLARDRPALFIEVDPAALERYAASVDSLLGWLAARGYEPHLLTGAGPRRCARGEIDRVLARRGYADLLFLASRN
jgi:FkbM family methyltransferase